MDGNPLAALAQKRWAYTLMLRLHRTVEWCERIVRAVTRDRLGAMDLMGLPAIRVTVSGRRTGTPRTSTLYCVDDGDRILVIGSNWGHSRHPAWSENLCAATEVDVRRRRYAGRAAVRLLIGTERDQAWATILRQWPNYQIAQDRVPQRPFRIFELRLRTPFTR